MSSIGVAGAVGFGRCGMARYDMSWLGGERFGRHGKPRKGKKNDLQMANI